MTIKGPKIAFRRVLPLFIQRTEPLSVTSRQIKFHSFHATAFAAITIKTTTDIYSKSSNSAKYDSVNTRFSLWGSGRRNLSIKATQVNDSGSIDSPLMQSMQNKIKENVNAESVTVKDAYGDGRHVSIDVVSSAFEGQSAVNRQRMVYKAIWEELQNTVHAVDQMTTRTPAEAAAAENS